MLIVAIVALNSLIPNTALAGINDDDLAGVHLQRSEAPPQVLVADRSELMTSTEGAPVNVYRERDGKRWLVPGLNFRALGDTNCSPGKSVQYRAELSSGRYRVRGDSGNYQVQTSVPCGERAELTFLFDSPSGQALGIWEIAQKAETKLAQEANLLFWQRQVSFEFPGDGDYYNWDTVHITLGHHWDVVGHELGHAIYDQAGLGAFGGGSHAIDQCYTNALALSEGWATYFSAWLSLDPTDADAKFEYIVPRLAPLPMETIPANVCLGPTNEWRVAGFFWDLFDQHDDGETAQQVFARSFSALQGKRVSSIQSAALSLARAGLPLEEIQRSWTQNILTPYPNSLQGP